MKKLSKKTRRTIRINIAFCVVLIWMGVTGNIQAFKCPDLTKTQLFLLIPQNFILKFKPCK